MLKNTGGNDASRQCGDPRVIRLYLVESETSLIPPHPMSSPHASPRTSTDPVLGEDRVSESPFPFTISMLELYVVVTDNHSDV